MFRIGYAIDDLIFVRCFGFAIRSWNSVRVLICSKERRLRFWVSRLCAACCACSNLMCVVANDLSAIPLSRNQSAVSPSSKKFFRLLIHLFSCEIRNLTEKPAFIW